MIFLVCPLGSSTGLDNGYRAVHLSNVTDMTDLNDTQILLGLSFCKAFDLVKIQCDDQCVCKRAAVDVLNEAIHKEYPRGLDVPSQKQSTRQPIPVDVNTKPRPDCKAHIMELFPELFEGIGTMKNAIVKLDVDQSVTPIVSEENSPSHGGTSETRN